MASLISHDNYDYIKFMILVNMATLKSHLRKYVRRVKEGETAVVTSHGHPVAKLVPYDNPEETVSIISPSRKINELERVAGIVPKAATDSLDMLLNDRAAR